MNKFISNGKLMITGEYLVLYGALALAVPLNRKQSMQAEPFDEPVIRWKSRVFGKQWFEAVYETEGIRIKHTSSWKTAIFVQRIIKAAVGLNPAILHENTGFTIVNDLDFHLEWGFGSSSTLISNVAYWFGVDPYALHRKVSRGSGYDIACARSSKPILFRIGNHKPEIQSVSFDAGLTEKIYFVYLGRKQDSTSSVDHFLSSGKINAQKIERISEISNLISANLSLPDFINLIDEHENILSSVLGKPGIKNTLFQDFEGSIKSLGAWGGDFIMAVTENTREYVNHYFLKSGLSVIFPYRDIALS